MNYLLWFQKKSKGLSSSYVHICEHVAYKTPPVMPGNNFFKSHKEKAKQTYFTYNEFLTVKNQGKILYFIFHILI